MRLIEVKATVGLGKTRIYELIKEGNFPAPCKPGGSASRWSENEINAWVSECVSERVH
ncbi:AlpA family phage regulatory protein [Sphingomonas faeni]